MMTGLNGFVCMCVSLTVVSCRVIDNNESEGYYNGISPAFLLEQLKQLNNQYGPEYYSDEDPYADWTSDDVLPGKPQFIEVPNWPGDKTRNMIGRQVAGVAVNSKNNLVVFHRADRVWNRESFGMFNRFNPSLGPIDNNVLMTIEPETGNVLGEFGSGIFYMPHGLTIDKDDNLWVTDVALHQVLKFEKNSTKPSLVLGEKLVPGSDDTHFCKPTDVAVASNGDFFVADGYCNGRILKYSADGTLLAKWGQPSGGKQNPGPMDLNVPHSLALDEERDLIMVADRENGRIQVYGAGLNDTVVGEFSRSYDPGRGTIYAIEYDSVDDVIYAVNGPGIQIIEGFTLDMRGDLKESWGPVYQEFGQPHDVTFSRDGNRINLFVGDIDNKQKLWRFVKDPAPRPVFG